jgi:hypothetical protein
MVCGPSARNPGETRFELLEAADTPLQWKPSSAIAAALAQGDLSNPEKAPTATIRSNFSPRSRPDLEIEAHRCWICCSNSSHKDAELIFCLGHQQGGRDWIQLSVG